MSICMRCGGSCTCGRHGKIPEELFYICCGELKYPVDHKGSCMESLRKVLDRHGEEVEGLLIEIKELHEMLNTWEDNPYG